MGKFSTEVSDCCAEPIGAGGCLYYTFCYGCAMGDMAQRIENDEIDRPVITTQVGVQKIVQPWDGGPWLGCYRCCCGTYLGACFASTAFLAPCPQQVAATGFTLQALRVMELVFLIKVDAGEYCMYRHCGCNLCVQVRLRLLHAPPLPSLLTRQVTRSRARSSPRRHAAANRPRAHHPNRAPEALRRGGTTSRLQAY